MKATGEPDPGAGGPAKGRRRCRQCGLALGVDDERCPACGTDNPVPLPWYTPLLGLAIVALLVLLLVDFDDVARLLHLR